MSMKVSRPEYAAQYGPTTGDKIHLADTGLVAEIEKDYTTYGDELVFGITADYNSGADVDELANGIETAVTRLEMLSQDSVLLFANRSV